MSATDMVGQLVAYDITSICVLVCTALSFMLLSTFVDHAAESHNDCDSPLHIVGPSDLCVAVQTAVTGFSLVSALKVYPFQRCICR